MFFNTTELFTIEFQSFAAIDLIDINTYYQDQVIVAIQLKKHQGQFTRRLTFEITSLQIDHASGQLTGSLETFATAPIK